MKKKTPRGRPKKVITKPHVICSPQTKKKSFPVNPVDMFNDTSISGIRNNYGSAIRIAADYDEREKYLLPAYVDDIKETDWIPAVYSIFKNLPFSKSQLGYNQFRNKAINEKRIKGPLSPKEEFFDEPKTGSGFIFCTNNIVYDVSRLEVLIGEKRAENNSPEIINEAADICQRLFQRGIMDIYRGVIGELADGYYSD